ncbi:MAG: 6,7-dimethyl-8-ribityllumazine synthase [Bacteroidales bacterium]|jgi:6,7-dimethyl-8-ribityllumazine synthase|nr:6,7-dimethyl-8-ribityllumazine synthase [Bacteroidales bacterium]
MATSNLSAYNPAGVPDASGMRIAIAVADWNSEITHSLLDGARNTLKKHGVREENIVEKHVPGTFELTYGARMIAENYNPDAVICIGCVIQGETPHFTYICQGVTQGITRLNIDYEIPFIFGVLTTDTLQQAADRAGGKYGNKGDEAAVTAIKMVSLMKESKTD